MLAVTGTKSAKRYEVPLDYVREGSALVWLHRQGLERLVKKPRPEHAGFGTHQGKGPTRDGLPR